MYTVPGVFEYRIMIGDMEYSYGLAISYVDKLSYRQSIHILFLFLKKHLPFHWFAMQYR